MEEPPCGNCGKNPNASSKFYEVRTIGNCFLLCLSSVSEKVAVCAIGEFSHTTTHRSGWNRLRLGLAETTRRPLKGEMAAQGFAFIVRPE